MKQSKIFIALAFIGIWHFNSKAQSPYDAIGKKTTMLTLTNGKYPEYIPYDSIQRIGSIVLNVKRMTVLSFLDRDSISMAPEVASRWWSSDPLVAKFPYASPYNFVLNNPINAIDPDGKDVYLVVYTTAKGESGHTALAVENYRTVENKVIENGIEVTKTTYEKTGTFTYYEFGPDVKKMGPLRAAMNVDGLYTKTENVTLEQIKNTNVSVYESDAKKPTGPNGVVKLTTTPETDMGIKATLEKKIAAQEDYNGVKNNCTDFVDCGVDIAVGTDVSAKENVKVPVLGTKSISTPNTLYKSATKASNATVVKDAGVEADKTYIQGRKGE